jgi:hypothetical protein
MNLPKLCGAVLAMGLVAGVDANLSAQTAVGPGSQTNAPDFAGPTLQPKNPSRPKIKSNQLSPNQLSR